MDWNNLFTSLEGRINRAKFWVGNLVLYVIVAVSVGLTSSLVDDSSATTAFVISYVVSFAIIFLAGLAVQVKRWHDRGKSGWWVLIAFIPIIGPLWVLIETGFLPGTPGTNEYGPDPLEQS